MAKLVPVAPEKKESIFGALRGLATIHGDIVSPIVEPWEWDEDIFPPGTAEREEFERNKKKSAGKTTARKSLRVRK